ncbi:Renalase [Thalictrum thalictroides]|uniref:Renalase n=1 Tax=Thalictrum thalictroides TaxID=46969 RepID=A0A7J6V2M5_THATH|nr:Renalase [Thalictrum thalictroides]
MESVIGSKVAVVGSGISGAVCASFLAKNGVSVTIFDSGRGPGGRMSTRREITEDGKELYFDHGAPFFAITDKDVMTLVCEWEARGLVVEWKENFGIYDCVTKKFVDIEKEGSSKKFVGIPGMNAICLAMSREPGIQTMFGVTVGTLQWLEEKKSWLPIDMDGQTLGQFDAVVVSDIYVTSPRFTAVTGRPPPLDISLVPELALKLQVVPALPCLTLMLAFEEPLPSIPVRGFSFKNSDSLSWAFCDSSKPGRCATSECWVVHSTTEYAKRAINQTGQQRLSSSTLANLGEELFREFQGTVRNIPKPFFMRAHRWDTAFPAVSVAGDDKCLWDNSKKITICGDFCVTPSVEGAIMSGMGAAQKILDILSSFL